MESILSDNYGLLMEYSMNNKTQRAVKALVTNEQKFYRIWVFCFSVNFYLVGIFDEISLWFRIEYLRSNALIDINDHN